MKATGRPLSVVMIGATGAVGGEVARSLLQLPGVERLTLLGRRPLEGIHGSVIHQHAVDIRDVRTYERFLPGHSAAICTLGVGQPSKIGRDEFVAIDKRAPLEFGTACRAAGVGHFGLLGSVGADRRSRSFFLRTKGELEAELEVLGFDRLSLFRPSMILTPTNRYGVTQALTLALWPLLRPLLLGGLRKYRGIPVDRLGRAMAMNLAATGAGVETLHWDAIDALGATSGER